MKPAEIAKLSGMLRGVREGSISVAPFLRSPEVVDPAALAVQPEWDAKLRRVVRLWRLSDEIDARVHPDGRPRWLICQIGRAHV